MCWNCVHEYYKADGVEWDDDFPFKLPDPTPEHVEIMKLMWEFYQLPGCSVGGPLHITLDDCNVEDHCLEFCREALNDPNGYFWNHNDEKITLEEGEKIKDVGNRILDALFAMPSHSERAITINRADVYGSEPGRSFF